MGKETYACGVGPAFDVVGGKWKAVILCELERGALRFGELKRRIVGASEKMVVQQLRALEQDGLVIRRVFPQVPPHVEYSLSDWGAGLIAALAPIGEWGEAYAKAHGRYPG